ncbi:MAG: hypothetical protein JXB39_06775 [Deltaproteobacteria bacterium]|nr:hypothetical protein [Deltaproteobacteria bacterium]
MRVLPLTAAVFVALAACHSWRVSSDGDADGWGTPEDCDDGNPEVHPDADELCNGLDDDCDGVVDEPDAVDAPSWYVDADGDAWGDPSTGERSCQPIGDRVVQGDDCDDGDSAVHPGAVETWYDGEDTDCSGGSDFDADGDGHDSDRFQGDDCDDTDPGAHPGAEESWYDGVDQDCDGGSDYDADQDGFDSAGYSGTDCDDTSPGTHPGADEVWYDGVDQDCAHDSDYDADRDGYDSDLYSGTDCDDADPGAHPGATETWYDGVDQDCLGDSDYDADRDGYDSDRYDGSDCNDANPEVHPGATEIWYDGVDGDCLGDSDYDADHDGYDHESWGGDDCDDSDAALTPADLDDDGWSTCDGDCDDDDASRSPSIIEVLDGIDNDCSGVIDDVPDTWTVTTEDDFALGSGDGHALFGTTGDGSLALSGILAGLGSVADVTSLPAALSSHGVVAANGFLYLVGGATGSSTDTPQDDVYCASITSAGALGSWSATSSLPTGVSDALVTGNESCLVVAGGTTTSSACSSAVYTAALDTDGTVGEWTAQAELPTGVTQPGGAVVRGYVYVIGGQASDGTYSDTVSASRLDADCSIDAWTDATDIPSGRASFGTAHAGSHLYTVGGSISGATTSQRVYHAEIDLDGSIVSWTLEDYLPSGSRGATATVSGSYLLALGGNNGRQTLDEIAYSAIGSAGDLGAWATWSGVLDETSVFHATASWDGSLFILGGRTDSLGSSATRTSGATAFTPTLSSAAYAHQSAWSVTFDLGADYEMVYLDWNEGTAYDGVTAVLWRSADDASGDYGDWNDEDSAAPLVLGITARYLQVLLETSSTEGTRTWLEDLTLGYR